MKRVTFGVFFSVCLLVGLIGCSGEEGGEVTEVDGPPPEVDDHSHAEKGPNGGPIVELGHDHDYHAELVADSESKRVIVYILSEDLESKPIAAGSLTLNLKSGDEPTSYELSADEETADGTSSFSSADEALFELFKGHKFSEGQVSIDVDGTPIVGRFKHADFH